MSRYPLNKCLLALGLALVGALWLYSGNVTNSNEVTFSIVSPKDGSLWVATRSVGLMRRGVTGRVFGYSSANGDFPCDSIVALAFDSEGNLWMRDARNGVYSYTSISGFTLRSDVPDEVRQVFVSYGVQDRASEEFVADSVDNTVSPERIIPWYGRWWAYLLILLIVASAALLALYMLRKRPVSAVQAQAPVPSPTRSPSSAPREPQPHTASFVQSTEFSGKVQQMVEARFRDPEFGVEALAEELGITRVHLTRKLKAENAPSPSDIIKSLRMEAACQMLKAGEKSVSEVASECGFASAAYFSSAFKAWSGVSPKEFCNKI